MRSPLYLLCAVVLLLLGSFAIPADAAVSQQGAAFNHSATSFPLTGAHRGVRCESCHKRGLFKGTSRQCAACHGTSSTVAATVMPARHIATTQACDTCHSTSSFAGARFSHIAVQPGTCATCHNGAAAAPGKPAGHVATNASCDTCHKTTTWSPVLFDHASVTPGNCATCHNGSKATGKPSSHIPTTASCDTCHKTTSWKPAAFDHSTINGAACATCHNGSTAKGKPSGHVPTTAACETCHSRSNFTSFAGAQMNHTGITTGCAACHETGKSFLGVTMLTRPTTLQDPNHPTTGDCSQCHGSTSSFTTSVSGGKPANHIPTGQPCTLCHTSPSGYKPGVMNHNGITTGCNQCHAAAPTGKSFYGVTPVPQGSSHIPTIASCETCHSGFTSFKGGKMNHVGISSGCASCHAMGMSSSFTGITVKTPNPTHIPISAPCETCHAPTNFTTFAGTKMNHTGITSGCATCHETGKTFFGVTMVTRPTAAQDPNHPATGDCSSCHTSTTSFTAGMAAAAKPSNHIPTTQPCTICHTNPASMKPGVMNHNGISSGCTQCHAAAASGIAFYGVTPVPQGAGHVPTGASCESCHTGFTSFAGGKMNHNGIVSGCATCHAQGKSFTGVTIKTPTPTHIPITSACETCHSVANFMSFAGTTMNHTGIVNGCATCHETGKTFFGVTMVTRPTATQDPNHPTTGDCSTCHKSTTAFTLNVSGAKPANHIPTAQACSLCHTNPASMKPGVMNHNGITSGCTQCHAAAVTGIAFYGVTPVPQGAGHVPTSASCESCHTGFTSFAGGKMNHNGIVSGCATCHATGKSFTGVTIKTPPTNHIPTTSACETCHSSSNFTTFAGTTMNHTGIASGCATCHETGKTFFGVTMVTRPTAIQDPNHPATGDCSTCHKSTTSFTMNVSGGTKPTNHIPTTQACSVCHTNPASLKPGVMNHTGITTGCVQCHAAAVTGIAFYGVTPVPQGAGHIPTAASCETCHTGFTSFTGGKMNHVGIASGCATCHASGKSFTGVTIKTPPATHIPATGACEACHSPTNFTTFAGTKINHTPVLAMTCVSCHETGMTWFGVKIVVRPSGHKVGRDCRGCHNTTSFKTGGSTPLPATTTTAAATTTTTTTATTAATATTTAATTTTKTAVTALAPATSTSTAPATTTTTKTALAPATTTPTAPSTTTATTTTTATAPTTASPPSTTTSATTTTTATTTTSATKTAVTALAPATTTTAVPAPTTTTKTAVTALAPATTPTAAPAPTSSTGIPTSTGRALLNSAIAPGTAPVASPIPASTLPQTGSAVAPISPALAARTAPLPGVISLPGSMTTSPSGMRRFDHIGVIPGACITCHNGSTASGKPANHIITTLSCDSCHRTTTWKFATFNHNGVTPGTCVLCHNGVISQGRPPAHFVTVRTCDSCHRMTGWTPAVPYRHESPAYRQHSAKVTCANCHVTNTETIPYKAGAYKPDCAACHAPDYKPAHHRKAHVSGVYYSVVELKDCSGACHEYTDATFRKIRKTRTGRHHATDGSF